MIKKMFVAAIAAILGDRSDSRSVVRSKTRDVAYQYRMGAGFPGDVNRTHPASIEPVKLNTTNPPTAFGQLGVLAADGTFRKLLATDTALTNVYGALVRSYPFQSAAGGQYGAESIGNGVPPTDGIHDVLRSGYIMGKLNVGQPQPVRGGQVFVWIAATSGNNIQGGLASQASAGNTIALDVSKYQFNGSADAAGVVELSINV